MIVNPIRCLLIAALIITPPIGAQSGAATATPEAKTGKAHISGVVVDSLNGRYLSGADVMIDGAHVILQTDSLGSFRIDTLPPGTYQIGVFHPLLDTLGTALSSKRFRVGPDSTTFVVLAIPSAPTIVHDMCQIQPGAEGASAVMGHVNDPETLAPIAHADVSLAWITITVSKEVGFLRTSHLVHDTTDNSGAYKFCGVPSSMQATLQARRGSTVTAEIPISVGDRPVELLARNLLLSREETPATVGTALVSGVVNLLGASTNAGTRVELAGTDMVTLTNEKGEFTLQNLPSGSRVLSVRHLGYGAETVPVDLSPHEPRRVSITLQKYVAVMDPVLVTARRTAALDKTGFTRRSKSGNGYFIGPEQLARMNAFAVTDILRRVPGLRVTPGQFGDVVSSSRDLGRGCIQYYLDEMPFQELSPGDISAFVNGHEVVAVEVYQSGFTPPQFIRSGTDCTSIVLWTRFRTGG